MLWLVDTSAWSRREVPAVKELLRQLVEDDGDELALSPAVLIELLRGPQWGEVAAERQRLEDAFPVLPVDDETVRIIADAMQALALTGAEAHRRPVTDLLTSALAHRHGAGILHFDRDYGAIAEHGGLDFTARRVCRPEDLERSGEHPVAGTQRALKKELHQLLHQLPVGEAEEWLRVAVERLRDRSD